MFKSKHSGWTWDLKRTPFGGGKGGGGGGGQPSQTTSTSNVSNIPEYARPYVETMLGATQKQLYQMDDSGNITGFQPYKAYGGTYDSSGNQIGYDPSKAIAGFSPMQTQAQQGVANLELPGTYAAGAGMTGIAGTNAMNAGQNYQSTVTNPGAMQQYMNPYIQNALQPQLQEMERQYGITGAQEMGNATKAGAFGGNREALMAAENQRNKNIAMNQAIGQGYNQAFTNAQQQAGNVANLGLQGYQAAGQAGSALANIGGQALQAQQGIYGAQNQMGAQQQAQQQQIINQSMQDYANAQQYPLMQLGVMSNMLRGLPMQASTTNQYVAAPNQVTQGIGLAGAGASIANALKKEGGVIKEKKMASGGIAGYNIGGSIKHDLYDMEPEEIQDYIKESASPKAKQIAQEVLRDKTGKAGGGIIAFADSTPENNQSVVKEDKPAPEDNAYLNRSRGLVEGVKNIIRPFTDLRNYDPLQKGSDVIRNTAQGIKEFGQEDLGEQARKFRAASPQNLNIASSKNLPSVISAVEAAPAPAPKPTEGVQFDPTAGGNPAVTNLNAAPAAKPVAPPVTQPGIKAAPSRDLMPTSGIKFPERPVEETQAELNKGAEERVAAYGVNEGNQKARAAAMGEKANAKDEARRMTSLRMAEFFGAWGSTPGNTIVAGLNAMKNKVPDFISDMKEEAKVRRQIDKDIAELDKLDREEKNGIKKDYFAERAKLADRAMHTYGHELNAAVHREGNIMQREVGLAQAAARGEGGGGGVAKNYNQAVMRYQTEDKNIAAEKKGDDEYKMAKRTLSIPSKANDPKALEIVKTKEAAWDNRLAALKEDVDYYKSKQKREAAENAAPSDKKAAPGTASNPIVIPK
jgi:hypothetical protein